MNKRGETERIADMPSFRSGPAICLEGGGDKEHNKAHKHTDRPAERIARSGKATGSPGTLQLGQAKTITARAIEKATGGKKGGGCPRAEIKKQLDAQFAAPDTAVVRGVRDSKSFNKNEAAMDAVLGRKTSREE